MASSGNGLNRRMPNVASTVVAPSARYQVDPAELAQAEVDRPVGPVTDCSTTPSAPSSSTTAAAHGATIRSPSRTSTLERSLITSGATAVWPSVEYRGERSLDRRVARVQHAHEAVAGRLVGRGGHPRAEPRRRQRGPGRHHGHGWDRDRAVGHGRRRRQLLVEVDRAGHEAAQRGQRHEAGDGTHGESSTGPVDDDESPRSQRTSESSGAGPGPAAPGTGRLGTGGPGAGRAGAGRAGAGRAGAGRAGAGRAGAGGWTRCWRRRPAPPRDHRHVGRPFRRSPHRLARRRPGRSGWARQRRGCRAAVPGGSRSGSPARSAPTTSRPAPRRAAIGPRTARSAAWPSPRRAPRRRWPTRRPGCARPSCRSPPAPSRSTTPSPTNTVPAPSVAGELAGALLVREHGRRPTQIGPHERVEAGLRARRRAPWLSWARSGSQFVFS